MRVFRYLAASLFALSLALPPRALAGDEMMDMMDDAGSASGTSTTTGGSTTSAPTSTSTSTTTSTSTSTTSDGASALLQSNLPTDATKLCSTPAELQLLNASLKSSTAQSCDYNRDGSCDGKDLLLAQTIQNEHQQQQQQQQQQGQQGQQGGGIGQQLASMLPSLLGQALGGGGGGGGGPTPPPPNPSPGPGPGPGPNPNGPSPAPANQVPKEKPGDKPKDKKEEDKKEKDEKEKQLKQAGAQEGDEADYDSAEQGTDTESELGQAPNEKNDEENEDEEEEEEKPEEVVSPEVQRFRDLIADQKTQDDLLRQNGYKDLMDRKWQNIKPNPELNPDMAAGTPARAALDNYGKFLESNVGPGKMFTPEQAASLYSLAEYQGHFKTSAGSWFNANAGTKGIPTGTDYLAFQNTDYANFLAGQQANLSNPAFLQGLAAKQGNAYSPFRFSQQEILNTADVSTLVQYGGTCWECHAIQKGRFWNAAEQTNIDGQLLATGQYTPKGGTPGVNTVYLKDLRTSAAADANWTPTGGNSGLVDQLTGGVVGKFSGNGNPWGGGNTPSANNGSAAVFGATANSAYGYNLASQIAFAEGADPVGYTHPFNGHAASFSAIHSNDGTGAQRFIVGDNSWGQGNEVFHLATRDNASKLTFPGGAGGIGGGLGGLGGLGSGLGNGVRPASSALQQQQQAAVRQCQANLSSLTQAQALSLRTACARVNTASPGLTPAICFLQEQSGTSTSAGLTSTARTSRASLKSAPSQRIEIERF